MAIHIASAFDKNYLTRAVAMFRSLSPSVPDAQYWFLCLDDETKPMMDKIALTGVNCVTLDEMGNQELLSKRKERNNIEFAMTSKSNFLAFLIDSGRVKDGDMLILTDVDILFYPAMKDFLVKEIADTTHSIFITPHKFPKYKEWLIPEVGYYNLGFITFRINDASKTCIRTWGKQCLNWCFLWHDYEHGWHTDQMYGDKWKDEYPGVYDLPDKGVNSGTWNIERFKITQNKNGVIFFDEDPLVCFHFHGLKMYINSKGMIKPYPICVWNDHIYDMYMSSMQKAYHEVLAIDPKWTYGFAKKLDILRWVKQTVTKGLRSLRKRK